MDLVTITSALSGIKSAIEISKSLLDKKVSQEVSVAMIELNEKLINTQLAVMAMQEEVMKKTEELQTLKARLSEKDNYKLVEFGDGQFACESKEGIEPKHRICQTCFDKGNKAVLLKGELYGSVYLECPLCKIKLYTGEKSAFKVGSIV